MRDGHEGERTLEIIALHEKDFLSPELPKEFAAVYQAASWQFYAYIWEQRLRTTRVTRRLCREAEIVFDDRAVKADIVVVDKAGLFPTGSISMTLWKEGDTYVSHISDGEHVRVERYKARKLEGRERIYVVGPMQKERDYDIVRFLSA